MERMGGPYIVHAEESGDGDKNSDDAFETELQPKRVSIGTSITTSVKRTIHCQPWSPPMPSIFAIPNLNAIQDRNQHFTPNTTESGFPNRNSRKQATKSTYIQSLAPPI